MSQNYNLDSESDDDEVEAVAAISGRTTWHLHDIEKVSYPFAQENQIDVKNRRHLITSPPQLKEQTSELLDPSWKDVRNKHLLNKMLELEQPTITAKVRSAEYAPIPPRLGLIACVLFVDGGLPAPGRCLRVADGVHHSELARVRASCSHRYPLECAEEVLQVCIQNPILLVTHNDSSIRLQSGDSSITR